MRTPLPASAMELSTSRAWAMPLANRAASSLLPKLSPHTCRASRHWWKLGVAWLYLRPLTIGQFITTWGRKRTDDQYKDPLGRDDEQKSVLLWLFVVTILKIWFENIKLHPNLLLYLCLNTQNSSKDKKKKVSFFPRNLEKLFKKTLIPQLCLFLKLECQFYFCWIILVYIPPSRWREAYKPCRKKNVLGLSTAWMCWHTISLFVQQPLDSTEQREEETRPCQGEYHSGRHAVKRERSKFSCHCTQWHS